MKPGVEFERKISIALEDLPRGYDVETSTLGKLNSSFPSFQEHYFSAWLSHFSQNGQGSVLEIGGGVAQTAAREIIGRFPLAYTALEPRDIEPAALQQLQGSKDFRWVQAPVEDLTQVVSNQRFDVVFAHNVAEHVRNPYRLLIDASKQVRPGGLIFVNRVTGYRNTVRSFVQAVQQEGAKVKYSLPHGEGRDVKAGIVRSDILIQVSKPLDIQLVLSEPLRNNAGEVFRCHDVVLQRREAAA